MPEFPPVRVYLDSNVLYSACHDPLSRFANLWRLQRIDIVTSQYAVGEVSRNIRTPAQRQRFEGLLAQTRFVSDADIRLIPAHIELVAKDAPILAAAIAESVDFLATGDRRHFSLLYDTTISSVRIIRPTDFLKLHKDRLIG